MNRDYNADIVLVSELIPGLFRVWHDNKPVATVTEIGRDLIAAGAAARKMSVYDAQHFLSGTMAPIFGDELAKAKRRTITGDKLTDDEKKRVRAWAEDHPMTYDIALINLRRVYDGLGEPYSSDSTRAEQAKAIFWRAVLDEGAHPVKAANAVLEVVT